MKLVSGFLGMTLASAMAIVSANAADMYRAPEGVSYKDAPVEALWQGSYVGINGGYAWGRDSSLSNYYDYPSGLTTTNFGSEGWFGGGQIGHNWQRDHLVFGIEADIEGANISGSTTVNSATAATNLDWFGTVRGRVGYSVGAALLYGTGGVAFGGVQDKLTAGGTTKSHDATDTGYVAGGGIEYAFAPSWSSKVEYQYINLGTDTLVNGTNTADFNHEYNTVRLGLNYHIHGGYEPLK